MRALVTGANGFLGRHVVAGLLEAGHHVRALVGPRGVVQDLPWADRAEILHVDLLETEPLDAAFEGVDVLVHLAARVLGDDRERIAVAVDGTERLLGAMARSSTRRVVLASSLAVYDWERVADPLTEASPLRALDAAGPDSYAIAKLRQEEVALRFAGSGGGWELSILRPSSLWGAGRLDGGDVGRRVGPLVFVVGPRRRLRISYVENCAEAFVRAALRPGAVLRVINVVDPFEISAWRYARECLGRSGIAWLRVPLPYRPLLACLRITERVLRGPIGGRPRLPGILAPARFETQFKPVTCSVAAAQRELGWAPRFGFAEALERTLATGHVVRGVRDRGEAPET